MKKVVVLSLLILNFTFAAGVGTTAANYLKIGAGARATAMANTYVGLANDISSVYWNPAGMTEMSKSEIGFTNLNHLVGISSKTLSGIVPVDETHYFGGYYTSLATPLDDETQFSNGGLAYTETGDTFKSAINVMSLSYARRWNEDISFGGNFKTISEDLAGERSDGMLIDLGLLYHNFIIKDLSFGAVMKNIGIKRLREDEEYPFLIAGGVSYKTGAFEHDIYLLADLEIPNDNSARLGLGAEYWIDMVAARIGYSNYNGFTMGIGLALDSLKADYAYVPFGELGSTHRISISYMLDVSEKQYNSYEEKWEEKIKEQAKEAEKEQNVFKEPSIEVQESSTADLFDKMTEDEKIEKDVDAPGEIKIVK